jgi:rare lipoprotein A
MTLLRICVLITSTAALVGSLGIAIAKHQVERGDAVYYSDQYKGAEMACGGKYHPKKLVAAHRTLPCGTRVRVKNRDNGNKVVVTIKDRGPYGDDELVIDVSRRAARKLDLISAGRAPVKLVVLHD